MSKVIVTVFAVMAAASGSVFAKGDAAAGKTKSVICVACHGATGMSPADAWPNLAGQGYAYLVKQMKAFRDGTRKDPLMEPMAKPLTDEDIENLAAYYSSQTVTAQSTTVLPDLPAPANAKAYAPIIPSNIVVPRPHPTRQYWADQMPEGEGRDIVVRKCQFCHDSQRTIAFARTKEQWRSVIDAMIERNTPITPEEIPVIVNYFTKYFGPDSPPILAPGGRREVGMKPCKPSEWPKGSTDFRKDWKGSHTVWLANQQGTDIHILDPVSKKIVRRIDCINAPDRVEFSGDGNTAYVPERVDHNIAVIDTRTGAIKAKIPLIARPNTASLSADSKKLYVGINPLSSDAHERGYIQVLDTATLKIVKTIETKGGIHYAWMSPDGKLLLGLAPESKFLNVYDTRTDELLYTCCTEASVGSVNVEAAPDGSSSRIFISQAGFYGIIAIDAKTGKEVKRVKHPVHTDGPFKGVAHAPQSGSASGFHGSAFSSDGKAFWAMAGSFVYKYELPSLKPLGDVHLSLVDQAGRPYTPAVEGTWMTISPDGRKVYAARPGRNLLSIIDAKTMKEEALIPTGEYPLHVSVLPAKK